jgi:y4mF family transcriptional regulator
MAKIQQLTRVSTATEMGALLQKTRKQAKLDQETAAGLAGVGTRFLGDVERGKPTVQLALVLKVLGRLGLELWIAPRGWKPPTP